MILVDTSIWVDHLRRSDERLVELLEIGEVAAHPLVVAELALGSIARRGEVLDALRGMQVIGRATDEELLQFIERRGLAARGIGVVDAHLLASVVLTEGARLWTRDKRLATVAAELGVGWTAPRGASL